MSIEPDAVIGETEVYGRKKSCGDLELRQLKKQVDRSMGMDMNFLLMGSWNGVLEKRLEKLPENVRNIEICVRRSVYDKWQTEGEDGFNGWIQEHIRLANEMLTEVGSDMKFKT